jgi:membrane protein required for colicin V production
MNWLDIVIAVLVLAVAVGGLAQGFIKTLFALAGVVVGVIVASNFYQELAGLLTFISDQRIANIVSFALILLAVLIIAAVIAQLLSSVLHAVNLGCIDRAMGAVLGFVIGVVLVSAILAGIVRFFGEGIVTGSWLARLLLDRFPLVLALLPGDFDEIRWFFR